MRWRTWLWAHLLLTIDKVLGTRLVERELARRQATIERLVDQLDAVNRDLDLLAQDLGLIRLALCLVDLKARSEQSAVDDWLRFAPQAEGDEPLLDSLIECLVKPGLAGVDVRPDGTGGYVYRLDPQWDRLVARLRGEAVASELMSWLEAQTSPGR